MTTRDLPPTSDTKFLERVREELQRLMGTRGGDPALRRSEAGGLVGGWSTVIVGGGTGGTGGTGTEPDLTPPPTPTFGAGDVSAGFTQVIVSWAGINYPQGHGNKQTVIYAVKRAADDPSLPTFPGDSGIVAVAPHALTLMALPSEMNTRWHIWLKFESNDGVRSANPAGGVNGVQATTGQDIGQLLELLTGQITRSQLYNDLGAKIDLIDGPQGMPGSVNARLKAEADARALDIQAEILARSNGDTNTLNAARTYTDNFTYSTAGVDSAIAAQATILRAEFASADATGLNTARAYTESYSYSRAAVDSGIAGVYTNLRAEFAAADSTVLANAQNYTNSYAYAKGTGEALANSVTALSAATVRRGSGTAINSDPGVRVPADWDFGQHGNTVLFGPTSDGPAGSRVMYSPPGAAGSADGRYGAPVTAGRRYRVSAMVRSQGGANGVFYLRYVRKNDDHLYVNQITISSATEGQAIPATWTKVSGEFVATPDDRYIAPRLILNWAGSVGYHEAQDIRIEDVTAEYSLNAALTNEITTRTSLTDAFAGSISTLQAQVNNPTTGNNPTYAALQNEAQVRASQTGELYAQWTVKLDVNGYVSGFGLASTANNAAPSSSFIVRADSFAVASPSGPGIAPVTPFVVRTTATTENGVTIPVGVYMDAAYIVNLSAMWARFGTLVADSIAVARINAANLNLGDGSVGGNLKSTSFGYGSGGSAGTGWLLAPNGTAYLNNAVVYGTVYASSGVFTGTVYASSGVFSGSLSGADISGATGTFSGALNVKSAASGARMEITAQAIKVFDASGQKRVQLGDLTA